MKYSRIIAGTMTWGKWGKQLSTAEMIALMNHCVENKITTFDHADIYGDYTNEEDFGKAFSKSSIKREDVQLISKCGIQFNVKERSNRVKHYDYNASYIISSVERSLKMLQTDYLDLLLLHRPSPLMDPSEIAEAIDKLKIEGKIKQFGVSNFSPSQIQLIEKEIQVEANQVEFSLSSNGVMNDGTLDDCVTFDRLAMSWSPLGSYFREDSKANLRIKTVLADLTKKYGATEDQLLLAWILKHPSTIHPVVGTATPQRLKLAMDAVEIDMELQDWFILLEANEGHEVA
ncbi:MULTISPECIES: aldo/keto reductase [Maribacter]|uniref:aldo/keto reductase n=1 Tax=Maribacter TaxID=252356 RepID=UPI000EEF4088|nr:MULTISPECIES: aldo/keto reductase [Maribacter]MDP2525997.1 aldo/keto reductase [Maribacter dokdonensis]CAG2535108.1 Predicted oxidoreductase [Maribacter dokdonensis]HAF77831.1 aldo/keto reductase [Maribacter sp.]HAI43307.1 aldo/keto reductase [Maribacter sp.]